MKKLSLTIATLLFVTSQAFAGMLIEDVNKKVLGTAAKIGCGTGLTCAISGAKVTVTSPGSNGLSLIGGINPTFVPFPVTATTGIGTSTTASATTVYLTQIDVTNNAILTGIAVNNAATCGTNKYIVALFDASGSVVANSATAGVFCSGAGAWQKIPFTATKAVVGPATYFVGVYMNGTTDLFFTIPQAGEYIGVAGTVTGQTFGTVSAVVLPTTFTAGAGPIVHTY